MPVLMQLVCVGRLEIANAVGAENTQQQRRGELEAIVVMKLNFGQQIAERNATGSICCLYC